MAAIDYTYLITTREIDRRGRFGTEPGETHFIRVPFGQKSYDPSHVIKDPTRWRRLVCAAADGEEDEITGTKGDVLVFVHGYNNDIETVLWRTEMLETSLREQGWRGAVVAFDWPSANSTLNYLEDRSDAAAVSDRMVKDAIGLLIDAQNDPQSPCRLNTHLVGHSTGAYVILEAFNQAQKRGDLYRADWRVAQVALIGGDIASSALDASSEWGRAMFDRCVRVTNYANRFDKVLGVSNAKRLGTAPRAGRVGLPPTAHSKAINVDCSTYFASKDPRTSVFRGTFNHSWHIGDSVFALDLAMTLEGEIDRHQLPTRIDAGAGWGLSLRAGKRPYFQAGWDVDTPALARRALPDPV